MSTQRDLIGLNKYRENSFRDSNDCLYDIEERKQKSCRNVKDLVVEVLSGRWEALAARLTRLLAEQLQALSSDQRELQSAFDCSATITMAPITRSSVHGRKSSQVLDSVRLTPARLLGSSY